jgi:hypothetical protein
MLWMGIWVHPYAILHVQVGVNLRENGVWPSLYDVAVSWLRLQTPKDCIPHPYWMYKKCLSTLRCCGWALGVNLRENGVWPSLYDIVWSWLRLQTPIYCIPHPYWMYTKHFSTLRCYGWAYGYTLMLYYMCRWGWIWGKMGYGRACMMLRCHGWGCVPPKTASHIHIGCIKSVWTPWDAVDGHMDMRLCRITCAGGGEFGGKWGMTKPVWYCMIMVEAANPHWLHPTSMLDVWKVFEHLEMLWMGIWACTYAVLHVQVGVNLRGNGVWL